MRTNFSAGATWTEGPAETPPARTSRVSRLRTTVAHSDPPLGRGGGGTAGAPSCVSPLGAEIFAEIAARSSM